MISAWWLCIPIYAGIFAAQDFYFRGWRRGWKRHAELAEAFEATVRPLERRIGWIRGVNGLPVDGLPAEDDEPAKTVLQ